ncbi:UNVERIFIED_CONTAM: hypothetical protein FKN15_046674 [Acipenser sinensis]
MEAERKKEKEKERKKERKKGYYFLKAGGAQRMHLYIKLLTKEAKGRKHMTPLWKGSADSTEAEKSCRKLALEKEQPFVLPNARTSQ